MLLLDHLISFTLPSGIVYPYSGVGEIVSFLATLIGLPFIIIGGWLVIEGLVRPGIQLFGRQPSSASSSEEQTQQQSSMSPPISKGSARRGFSPRTVIVGLSVLVALAVADGDLIWWITGPYPLYTYRGHSLGVNAVAWSPDSTRIASGSDDGMVQVWDATNGGNVFTYRGHASNVVYAVAWSPDGTRIASGSGDGTVQVWDATDGRHVFTYRGHAGSAVEGVAWSPDGRRIASGGDDSTVQVWDATD